MLNKFAQISIKKIFTILVIVAIVYNSGYLMMTTSSSIALPLLVLSTVIILFKPLSKGLIFNFKYNFVKYFYLLLFSIILTFVLNWDVESINIYLHHILILLFSVVLVSLIKYEDFMRLFIKTMKYIAIISLIMFFIIEVLGHGFDVKLVENTNGRIFYDAKVFFYPQYHSIFRNQGLFWEPGIYASFLIIALIFEIFLVKRSPRKINITIFLITLITTKSSAGYALLLLVLLAFLLRNKKSLRATMISIFGIFLFVVLIINYDNLLNNLYTISPEIFGKFIANDGISSSRFIAPKINLLIFMEQPLFGVGLSEATNKFVYIGRSLGVNHQTSTSTFYLASLGIMGSIFTFLWIFSIMKIRHLNISVRVIILTIFLVILNKEPHSSILVTNCILFNFLRGDFIKKQRIDKKLFNRNEVY